MSFPETFPNDENGDVMRRMQRDGDDLSKPRDIDFGVIFPSKIAAEAFAIHFNQNNYKVSIKKWDTGRHLPWDVTVTRYMLPDHGEITDMEERFELVAASL